MPRTWCTWRARRPKRSTAFSRRLQIGCAASWCARIVFSRARSKPSRTRGRSSRTTFGARCRKCRPWYRVSRWESICFARGAEDGGPKNRWSRKKSCLFNRLWRARFSGQAHEAPAFFLLNLANPAPADDALTVIENSSLPGGDGALRSVKNNPRVRGVQRRDRGFGWNVLVADLHRCAHWFIGNLVRDPVDVLHIARRGAQRLIISHHHAIVLAVNGHYVERLARCKSQALALPNGEVVYPTVTPDNDAVFGNNLALVV